MKTNQTADIYDTQLVGEIVWLNKLCKLIYYAILLLQSATLSDQLIGCRTRGSQGVSTTSPQTHLCLWCINLWWDLPEPGKNINETKWWRTRGISTQRRQSEIRHSLPTSLPPLGKTGGCWWGSLLWTMECQLTLFKILFTVCDGIPAVVFRLGQCASAFRRCCERLDGDPAVPGARAPPPPYSPDLPPADFFLFWKLKDHLAGKTLTQETFGKDCPYHRQLCWKKDRKYTLPYQLLFFFISIVQCVFICTSYIYIILHRQKVIKNPKNSRNQVFSLCFWLVMERSWSESGSGFVPLTNRSGSWALVNNRQWRPTSLQK
jgi:hypothetical protein